MESKGETISRIRNLIKGVQQDSFFTDRLLYSVALKYAKLFIKRLDDQNKLSKYDSIYQLLSVELIDVSAADASCADLATCCTFKRTKERLPELLNGSFGPMIRTVSSVDQSKILIKTYAKQFARMAKTTTFKYNKYFYYWLSDGYAYFPNLTWEEVLFEAMWENSIEEYKCCTDNCCVSRQSEPTNIPDFLFADIEIPVKQELLNMIQIPPDGFSDKQNVLRA